LKLHGARILFVVGIALGLFSNLVQAASAPELAVYRATDRQARLEKAQRLKASLSGTLRSTPKTYSGSSPKRYEDLLGDLG
jgi:hypothetical protein